MSKISDTIKVNYMDAIKAFLEGQGDEVLLVKSGTFSIPWANSESGEEGYINITFSIPKGERGGSGYNGHDEAENYEFEQAEKAAKRAEAKAKAEAKKARDAEARKAKATAKAE